MDVLLVVSSLHENSLVRAFALSQVLDCAGLCWRVVSLDKREVWPPLAESDFAENCCSVGELELGDLVRSCGAVIALKPLPESLGVCLSLAKGAQRKIIVDMDDPDLELRLERSWPFRVAAKLMRPGRYQLLEEIKEDLAEFRVIVSNPSLQARWGGVIIPHVRFSNSRTSETPGRYFVLFIGTIRRHKGLARLRKAVADINSRGIPLDLVISQSPPTVSPEWEQWIGPISLARARELERGASAIVCTLWSEPYKSKQLSAKAVDAIVADVPVVVNPGTPVDWLIGQDAIHVSDQSTKSLADALLVAVKKSGTHRYSAEVKKKLNPESYVTVMRDLLFEPRPAVPMTSNSLTE